MLLDATSSPSKTGDSQSVLEYISDVTTLLVDTVHVQHPKVVSENPT